VIVEFGASWAAACAAMKSVFDDLARDHPTAIFLRADVEQHPEVASRYGILRVPSYCFFFCGEKEVEFAGCSERKLRETLANCIELGPQVSWRALAGTKKEAVSRSKEASLRRAAELGQQGNERRLQTRAEEEEEKQREREAHEEAHRAFAELAGRWQENRWTAEEDRQKEEGEARKREEADRAAQHRRVDDQRQKETTVARQSLQQAQLAMDDLQRRQEDERKAKVRFQQEAQEDLERKDREIEELKASLDQARQAKANVELLHTQMTQESSKLFEEQLTAQEQRASDEAARLSQERERLEQEALEAKKATEKYQRIHKAEANGHVKFDPEKMRIDILADVKFKPRYYGTDRKDEPSAEFADRQLAQAVFGDLEELLAVHDTGFTLEFVRSVKLPQDAGKVHEQKDKWNKALQRNRLDLLLDHLLQVGAPRDSTSRLVYGPLEEMHLQLIPLSGSG